MQGTSKLFAHFTNPKLLTRSPWPFRVQTYHCNNHAASESPDAILFEDVMLAISGDNDWTRLSGPRRLCPDTTLVSCF